MIICNITCFWSKCIYTLWCVQGSFRRVPNPEEFSNGATKVVARSNGKKLWISFSEQIRQHGGELTWQRQLLRSESPSGLRWHLLFERANFSFSGHVVSFHNSLPIFVSFSCDQTKIYGEIAKASGGSCGLQCHHECLPETCHWLVVHIVESACFFKMPLLIFQKMSPFGACFYMIQVW